MNPVNEAWARYQAAMRWLARCAVVLMLYGVAASMALASLGTVLALACWLMSGDAFKGWPRLRAMPVFWPLVLLPALVVLGMVYSVAPLDYAGRYLGVYSRLLLVLVIVSMINDPVWQRRCWLGFGTGVAVVLLSTYASVWVVVPWSQSQQTGWGGNHSVFYDYIAQGVMTSFVAVAALAQLITQPGLGQRGFWLAVLVAAVLSLMHLLIGRTGQVVMVLALAGVLLMALPPRRAVAVLAVLLGLLAIVAVSSPVLGDRFALILTDIQTYRAGEFNTSIGARLSMWVASLDFFLDQPWWGHGTGAYRWLAEQVFTDPEICRGYCVHPHNQFLFFGVEHGLPGVLVYGWLLLAVAQVALQLERRYALMLGGWLVMVFVDSFINSPFWISSERNFYTAILGLLLTSFYLNRKDGPAAHA